MKSGKSIRRGEYNASLRARRDADERSFGSLRKQASHRIRFCPINDLGKIHIDGVFLDKDFRGMTPRQVKKLKANLLAGRYSCA